MNPADTIENILFCTLRYYGYHLETLPNETGSPFSMFRCGDNQIIVAHGDLPRDHDKAMEWLESHANRLMGHAAT